MRGNFFADKMITPAVLNGKGFLPPGKAKAAKPFCGRQKFLPGKEQIERELLLSKPTRQ
jgi:hypothetical protein